MVRWQMEIRVCEENTVTSSVQGTDLLKKHCVFWATGTTSEPSSKNRTKTKWSFMNAVRFSV